MKNNVQKAAFLIFCGTIIATSIKEGGQHHEHCEQCKIATGKEKANKAGSSIALFSYYSKLRLQGHQQ